MIIASSELQRLRVRMSIAESRLQASRGLLTRWGIH